MIGSLSRREDFQRLSRNGRRIRRNSMTLVALVDPAMNQPKLAFAVPRAHGSAVDRNRIRRRLRAACRELDRDGALASGLYLIAPRPQLAQLDRSSLMSTLDEAFRSISAS